MSAVRMLIVENNAIAQSAIRYMIKTQDSIIAPYVNSCEEALEAIREHVFHVVLMGFLIRNTVNRLPDDPMDGETAIKEIRRMERQQHLMRCVIYGITEFLMASEDHEYYISLDIEGILQKSFSREELSNILKMTSYSFQEKSPKDMLFDINRIACALCNGEKNAAIKIIKKFQFELKLFLWNMSDQRNQLETEVFIKYIMKIINTAKTLNVTAIDDSGHNLIDAKEQSFNVDNSSHLDKAFKEFCDNCQRYSTDNFYQE